MNTSAEIAVNSQLEKNLIKALYIANMVKLFSFHKQLVTENLIQQLNSAPVPQTRFLRAELKRLCEAEIKFLKLIDAYPADHLSADDLRLSTRVFEVLTGEEDF